MRKFIQFEEQENRLENNQENKEGFEDFHRSMTNAFSAVQTMDKLHRVIKKCSNENYSLIEKTVQITYSYNKQLVGDFSKNLIIGTENFSLSKRRSIALEGIGDWISKIWEMIINFFKKIWNWIIGKKSQNAYKDVLIKGPEKYNAKVAKIILEQFLFPGDNLNDYKSNYLKFSSVKFYCLDLIEDNVLRFELYEDFLQQKIDKKRLIMELKKIGFRRNSYSKRTTSKHYIEAEISPLFTDCEVFFQLPNYTEIDENNFKDIENISKASFKIKKLNKEEIEKFRESLDFSKAPMSEVNNFHGSVMGTEREYEKEKNATFKKVEVFSKRMEKPKDLSELIKSIDKEKKDNNKEEEWLKDLKDDYLSVGKALLNEGKSAYEIISILERLDFLGFIIIKNINNLVASVYRTES